MNTWDELPFDGRLKDLLYAVVDATSDGELLATSQELVVHLEDHLDYCDAEMFDGNDCPAYVAPGAGAFCEAHREMGKV